eukprot:755081-Hanusia_phi.AAC.1
MQPGFGSFNSGNVEEMIRDTVNFLLSILAPIPLRQPHPSPNLPTPPSSPPPSACHHILVTVKPQNFVPPPIPAEIVRHEVASDPCLTLP